MKVKAIYAQRLLHVPPLSLFFSGTRKNKVACMKLQMCVNSLIFYKILKQPHNLNNRVNMHPIFFRPLNSKKSPTGGITLLKRTNIK
uniref:Uncharacterized protein n=1 Tax=Rhizophora mucronata TaxID=61149 RepID=A0A2P2N533_RHIMU